MDDELQESVVMGAAGGWRAGLAWAGAVVLGLVLLVAAWGKMLDPVSFAAEIERLGLDFLFPASLIAWVVIVAEVVLGLALLIGLRTRLVLVSAGALVLVFLVLTGSAYWQFLRGVEPSEASCGCFGNLVSRTPSEAFWQDIFLLLPPYLLLWLRPVVDGGKRLLRWSLVTVAALAAGGLAAFAPNLPLDDLATRLSPGRQVSELCAAGKDAGGGPICLQLLVPELTQGRHLVVIDELTGADLQGAIDLLNGQVSTNDAGVWLLTAAEEEERTMFFWEWGPLFEVREVPQGLLRPLYRTLPRSFAVEEGRVVKTWAGLPNFDEL